MNDHALHFLEGIDDPKIVECMVFAVDAHQGQFRKYTGEPYVAHTLAVANKVAFHCKKNGEEKSMMVDMICAAILHDTLEDCEHKVTRAILEEKFGTRVKDFVYWLTAPSKGLSGGKDGHSRHLRKLVDHDFLARAPAEVLAIKACDVLHNGESVSLNEKGFATLYMREVAELFNRIEGLIKYKSVRDEYEAMLRAYIDNKGSSQIGTSESET